MSFTIHPNVSLHANATKRFDDSLPSSTSVTNGSMVNHKRQSGTTTPTHDDEDPHQASKFTRPHSLLSTYSSRANTKPEPSTKKNPSTPPPLETSSADELNMDNFIQYNRANNPKPNESDSMFDME